MTACARCEQHHDGDTDLCALCAAAVALDNAEADYSKALRALAPFLSNPLLITYRSYNAYYAALERLSEARRAYHALCLAGDRPLTQKYARVEKRSSK